MHHEFSMMMTAASTTPSQDYFFRFHSLSDIGENEIIENDDLTPVKSFLCTVFESRIQLYQSGAVRGGFLVIITFMNNNTIIKEMGAVHHTMFCCSNYEKKKTQTHY